MPYSTMVLLGFAYTLLMVDCRLSPIIACVANAVILLGTHPYTYKIDRDFELVI